MEKLLILATFHRYLANPESSADRPRPEIKDSYPAGKTVEASEEDAADWIAKGLAKLSE